MKTTKKIVGLMMLAMLLILAQIMPAMAEEGSTEGETKSVTIVYAYMDKNGNSKTVDEIVKVPAGTTGRQFFEMYKNKTFDDAAGMTGWIDYYSEDESPVNSYVWFYATGQATYTLTIDYIYKDTNGVTVNQYVDYTAKDGITLTEFVEEHETDIHKMDDLAGTTEWDFSYLLNDYRIDQEALSYSIYAVYPNKYRISYAYMVRGVNDYFYTREMWLPDEYENGSEEAYPLVEANLRTNLSSYKDYALESCVWNDAQSRYEIILCPDPNITISTDITFTYLSQDGTTKRVTRTLEIPQGMTVDQYLEENGYPIFDDAVETSNWDYNSYAMYDGYHYDGYTVYIMENEGDEENLGWSEEGLLFYEGGNHPAVFIVPNDYEIGSDEIYDLVEANFKAKYPEYANYTCYKKEYVEWNASKAKTHYRMYFVLEKDDEATPTPTPAVKPVTKGFSIENITYSDYKEAGTYLSAYNENPSATTLATNLKAISSSVDTSILTGNVSVSEFFEVNNDNGSDKAATVALNFKNIVDSSKGKVSAVYAYHYCKTHTRVELVTGTNLNTTDGTASFSFDALSPVALVVTYSKTESTTPATEPATEPATTPSTTPATTPATTTETTAVSATSPNTGANDITALLMVVAVVSLGAAAVVGKKKFF
jgi:hypothetical protein